MDMQENYNIDDKIVNQMTRFLNADQVFIEYCFDINSIMEMQNLFK